MIHNAHPRWNIAIVDKSLTITPNDGTICYGPSVEIDGTLEAVVEYINQVDPEVMCTLEFLRMVPIIEGHSLKSLIMIGAVPVAKIDVSPLASNACVEERLPGDSEEAPLLPTEIRPEAIPVQDWISELIKYARSSGDETLSTLVESMPDDLRNVGLSRVIVPTPDFVTDDMMEATRGLLVYTDTFGTIDAEYVIKSMSRRAWVGRNIPEYFKQYQGHLTKDARACLAYALTIAAYTNPPAPEERHFASVDNNKPRVAPTSYGCKLSITDGVKSLNITREFESWRVKVTDGSLFDLQINRHQLPEYWRKLFKKNAIEISGLIKKTESGEISLESERISLGLRNENAGGVTFTFEKSLTVPRGF